MDEWKPLPPTTLIRRMASMTPPRTFMVCVIMVEGVCRFVAERGGVAVEGGPGQAAAAAEVVG